MTDARSEWIDAAWGLILDQKYNEARRILLAITEEKDSALAVGQALNKRWTEVADAEECLATIAYLSGDRHEVIRRAQQSIIRSDTFRVGAHLLAAKAHASLGETELAASKLRIVISRSGDLGVAGVVLACLGELMDGGGMPNE